MNTSPPTVRDGAIVGIVSLGIVLVLIGLAVEPVLGWAGILVGSLFGLTIAIGSALFASLCVASGAQWWKPIRTTCLELARTLPIPAIGIALVVALGVTTLYPWANEAFLAESHLVHGKIAWLNHGFFAARSAVILFLWLVLIAALRKSLASGNAVRFARTGIVFLLVFGLTISVGFWDWTMSLEPEWFSTMHGVYGFSGAFQVGIAITLFIAARDPKIDAKPLYDLGSMLIAFSCFWGYIWYCQGMLIWYANIPEETFHYANALSGGWSTLFWLNPLINVFLPLVLLVSRHGRRSRVMLSTVAALVIVGHFLDMLLLVGPAAGRYNTPEVGGAYSVMPLAAIGAALAVGGGMMLLYRKHQR